MNQYYAHEETTEKDSSYTHFKDRGWRRFFDLSCIDLTEKAILSSCRLRDGHDSGKIAEVEESYSGHRQVNMICFSKVVTVNLLATLTLGPSKSASSIDMLDDEDTPLVSCPTCKLALGLLGIARARMQKSIDGD
jgi:hypothetical protein